MRRRSLVSRQLALLAAMTLGLGVAPAEATEPMSFHLESLGGTTQCRRRCESVANAEVIVAQGEIGNDTADEFLAFLTDHLRDRALRPVVLIHSPGGTVVGAMQLGLMFRRIGAAVIVARTINAPEIEQAQIVPGMCMSACVYAFFGGKRRVVPSVSRLGIHRMAIYETTHDPSGGSMVTRSFGTGDIVSALSNYTRLMGVNPEVIDYAERVAPESIHIVTPREIQRWRLGSPHL